MRAKQFASEQCENANRPALPYGAPIVRNLIYHVAPIAGNGVWRLNVEQLLRRIGLFNGQRIVSISTAKEFDEPDEVKAAFRGQVTEFLAVPNSRQLGEVATFPAMLQRVASMADNEITFYGHAKGVSRPTNDRVTVHDWARIQYETCLDYMPLVEDLLLRHPVAGSFKKIGSYFGNSRGSWHYSGTFYWLRNSQVFSRRWRKMARIWGGVECWPGMQFSIDEAATIFMCGARFNLYDYNFFHNSVVPAYERWKFNARSLPDSYRPNPNAASDRDWHQAVG